MRSDQPRDAREVKYFLFFLFFYFFGLSFSFFLFLASGSFFSSFRRSSTWCFQTKIKNDWSSLRSLSCSHENSDECAKSRAAHIIVSSSHEAAVCVCVRVKERERERERTKREKEEKCGKKFF